MRESVPSICVEIIGRTDNFLWGFNGPCDYFHEFIKRIMPGNDWKTAGN